MRIKAYDEMLESIKQFEAEQRERDKQLAAVTAEVDQARQRLNALLDKALEKPEKYAAEVGKAQGMVTIAEAKLQRLQAKFEAEGNAPGKQFPVDMTVAFQNVQSEIRNRIADGSLLFEEFQPILNEMDEHRKAYMGLLKAVLIKKEQLNKRLAHIQHRTADAVEQYTGQEQRFGIGGPEQIGELDFRHWAWVEQYAYENDLGAIRKEVGKTTSPEIELPPDYRQPDAVSPSSKHFQDARQL